MNIRICVGSSCHLKGSYEVIEEMKKIARKYRVEDLVELQASFCLGFCAEGVSLQVENTNSPELIKIDENVFFLHNIQHDNAEEVFAEKIYPLIQISHLNNS